MIQDDYDEYAAGYPTHSQKGPKSDPVAYKVMLVFRLPTMQRRAFSMS
jgi:hypothetical protein